MSSKERLLTSLRRIIRAEFPNYTYQGIYEYAIQSVSGSIVQADPTNTNLGLPSINGIKVGSSTLGDTVVPTVGNLILVAFVNGDSTRPTIISNSPSNETIAVDAQLSIQIGGAAAIPAARVTDPVLVGGWMAGNIVQGSKKVSIG